MRLLVPGLLVGVLIVSAGACTSASRTAQNGADSGADSGSGNPGSHGGSAGRTGAGHAGSGNGHPDSGFDASANGGAGNPGTPDSSLGPDGSATDANTQDAALSPDSGGGSDAALVACHHNADCDDNDACTTDTCDAGACMHDALVIDDNDECTTDSCDSNTGVIEHAAIDIDDSDGCTTDACDSANGNVSHDFCASALCDTTNACLTISDVGTFTHAPSLTIPTTAPPNVVTDTITVSGLGTVLRDVDVTTFITHSFSSDLDVTLQSPAGTIVTLTSDNGAGFDDVFNGTVWNDSADLTNVGNRAADHVYADLTLASPLTPEEPLGAFIGENPNGTWTLTISDDSNLDGGALASWGLDIKTITAAPTVTNQVVTQSAALAIADVTNQSSNVNVPAATGTSICSITVDTNITHTSPVDLVIMLSSPSGTTVTLTSGNGGSTVDAFAGTTWNDDADPSGQVPYAASVNLVTDHTYVAATVATPLTPEEALSAFIGEDPEGTWTLEVDDTIAGDTGTLNSWSLNIGRCMRAP